MRMQPAVTNFPPVIDELETVAHTLCVRIACFVDSIDCQLTGVFCRKSKTYSKDMGLSESDKCNIC